MSKSSYRSESLEAQSDSNRADFLKRELALGFAFSTIAATNYDIGDPESAQKSMTNAEKAYETVDRFLSDPKHSKLLSVEQIQDMRAELERLLGRLDGLLRRLKK
jgi:hypothetical protein